MIALTDTSRSAHARLRPVPVDAVKLADSVWAPRLKQLREAILPAQYRHLEDTGRLDNFRRASGRKEGEFQGIFFNDSDVYKWAEAAALVVGTGEAPRLARILDMVIEEIAAAQQPDGYLNTYFMFDRAKDRWSNLKDMHELYCGGHLIQAAVAHHRATGNKTLLDVARRFADHVDGVFGPPEKGKRLGACGHEEIEPALVELFRETGEQRYLDLAAFFVGARGRGAVSGQEYHQDHKPFVDADAVVGHAVRQMYLCAGAADVALETGDAGMRAAMERLWTNMTERRMYVTGGVGARHEGEAFGKDWELPNERAYAETCAAIGSAMWNWRMLALTGEAKYADVMELALYNGTLSGLSLDGRTYFYVNPLADDGTHRRQPWFGCACCPPNVARTLAGLPGQVYSVSAEGVWVHLYAMGAAQVALPDGRMVAVNQYTNYPWDGAVKFEVGGEGEFSLFLRIPGWVEGMAAVKVRGMRCAEGGRPGNYFEVRHHWRAGDVVELELPMPPRRIAGHPRCEANRGCWALARGPLIHCLEGADHPGFDVRDAVLPPDAALSSVFRPDLLGGCSVVTARAGDRELTAIPYHLWANREAGPMQVWTWGSP